MVLYCNIVGSLALSLTTNLSVAYQLSDPVASEEAHENSCEALATSRHHKTHRADLVERLGCTINTPDRNGRVNWFPRPIGARLTIRDHLGPDWTVKDCRAIRGQTIIGQFPEVA